jgi:MFS family permease
MNEPLHPSSLGEILDQTVQLYRSRFLVFLGISVVPTTAVLAMACLIAPLFAWVSSHGPGSGAPWALFLATLLLVGAVLAAIPALLGAVALAMAAMSHAVSRAYMGEKTTIRDTYEAVWRRRWRYLWLLILEGLIIGAAPMAVWIGLLALTAYAAMLAQDAGINWNAVRVVFALALGVLIVALACYFFWMLLRLSLAFPACVIEQIDAWAGVKRSNRLSKGTKGRIFVLFLLASVLNWIISIASILTLAIAVGLIAYFLHLQQTQIDLVIGIVVYPVAFAVPMFIRPIYGIALTLLYYDQRIRLEGFDIEWMMQRAGMVALPPIEPEAAPQVSPIPLKPQTPGSEPP